MNTNENNVPDRLPDNLPSNGESRIAFSEAQYAFLRMMGHELRSPLNSIVGTCEMLRDSVYGELDARQNKAIARVYRNGNRLEQILSSVLFYCRIAANACSVQLTEISLNSIVAASIEKCKQEHDNPAVVWTVEFTPSSLEPIQSDADYLAYIVNAVISNAAHYTKQGSVRVTLESTADRQRVLTVEDSGIGISQDEMGHLFEPFWRSPEAKRIYAEGTGLGLSIIRDLLGLLKGTLTVQSTLGSGTRVQIVLPDNVDQKGLRCNGSVAKTEEIG